MAIANLEPGDNPVDQPGLLDGATGVCLVLLGRRDGRRADLGPDLRPRMTGDANTRRTAGGACTGPRRGWSSGRHCCRWTARAGQGPAPRAREPRCGPRARDRLPRPPRDAAAAHHQGAGPRPSRELPGPVPDPDEHPADALRRVRRSVARLLGRRDHARPRPGQRLRTRPDMGWGMSLLRAAEADPEVRASALWRADPMVQEYDGRLRQRQPSRSRRPGPPGWPWRSRSGRSPTPSCGPGCSSRPAARPSRSSRCSPSCGSRACCTPT